MAEFDDNDAEQRNDDEPARDDEGLLLEYDVAICGTGLVQSILASALTRAGKSVLHCDGADYYGELDAVWNLSLIQELWEEQEGCQQSNSASVLEEARRSIPMSSEIGTSIPLSPEGARTSFRWHSRVVVRSHGIEIGTKVKTPYGNGVVQSISTTAVGIELNEWKLANGKSPTVFVGIPAASVTTNGVGPVALEEFLYQTEKVRSLRSVQAEEIMQKERYFALDATPAFVLASGRAVQGMLASGVADYLEFKAIEGLYWLENEKGGDGCPTLSRVPCSKNDVFGTKLLAPMEKRRLMKFIQLSMDYATKFMVTEEMARDQEKNARADGGEDVTNDLPESEVQSLNERHLNQGRSLARPQNKAVASGEIQLLEQCINDDTMGFGDFLEEKYKLSPKLRSIVRYALAWETETTGNSLADGMSTLRKHLQALGRYGTTAFLVPMYGSGELSQAFCRSAAVFGATYLLRRAPLAIQLGKYGDVDEDEGHKLHNVRGILLSGDPQSDNPIQKIVKCSHVIAPTNAVAAPCRTKKSFHGRQVVLRRISILTGKIIPSESCEQRHVIFIPPQTVGNANVVHGVLLDSSACVAPSGCTLLHLTTTETARGDDGSIDMSILESAQAAILKSKATSAGEPGEEVNEIYHVSFSYECPSQRRDCTSDHTNIHIPSGLHLCNHSGQELTADVAFEKAHDLFTLICPGMEFLGLSDVIDKAVRERVEEKRYDDDEKLMLESALGLIHGPPSTNSSADTKTDAAKP